MSHATSGSERASQASVRREGVCVHRNAVEEEDCFFTAAFLLLLLLLEMIAGAEVGAEVGGGAAALAMGAPGAGEAVDVAREPPRFDGDLVGEVSSGGGKAVGWLRVETIVVDWLFGDGSQKLKMMAVGRS